MNFEFTQSLNSTKLIIDQPVVLAAEILDAGWVEGEYDKTTKNHAIESLRRKNRHIVICYREKTDEAIAMLKKIYEEAPHQTAAQMIILGFTPQAYNQFTSEAGVVEVRGSEGQSTPGMPKSLEIIMTTNRTRVKVHG